MSLSEEEIRAKIYRRKTFWRYRKKTVIYKPMWKALEDIIHSTSRLWISSLQICEKKKNAFMLLKPPNMIFKNGYINLHSQQQSTRISFSLHLYQHFLKYFYNSHSKRCGVISNCGFDWHFPNYYWCWVPFHVPVSYFVYLLWRKWLFKTFAHFYKSGFLKIYFATQLYEFLM